MPYDACSKRPSHRRRTSSATILLWHTGDDGVNAAEGQGDLNSSLSAGSSLAFFEIALTGRLPLVVSCIE